MRRRASASASPATRSGARGGLARRGADLRMRRPWLGLRRQRRPRRAKTCCARPRSITLRPRGWSRRWRPQLPSAVPMATPPRPRPVAGTRLGLPRQLLPGWSPRSSSRSSSNSSLMMCARRAPAPQRRSWLLQSKQRGPRLQSWRTFRRSRRRWRRQRRRRNLQRSRRSRPSTCRRNSHSSTSTRTRRERSSRKRSRLSRSKRTLAPLQLAARMWTSRASKVIRSTCCSPGKASLPL